MSDLARWIRTGVFVGGLTFGTFGPIAVHFPVLITAVGLGTATTCALTLRSTVRVPAPDSYVSAAITTSSSWAG